MAKEEIKKTTKKTNSVTNKKAASKTETKKMSEANIGISLITLILCLTIIFLVGYIIYHM